MAANESYLPRHLISAIAEALSDTPVVCLLGPRQCGKSTLVQTLVPDRAYLDLDDEDFAATARADPAGFVRGLPERITLDEVQHVPEILRAIKVSVDKNRKPGRFILTGSANLLLLPRASESLAGRMEILQLHPLTEAEKERNPGHFLKTLLAGAIEPEIRTSGKNEDPLDLPQRLVAGGYPEVIERTRPRAKQWYNSYLRAILERDVPQIAQIREPSQLRSLLAALANQSASLLNTSSLGRDLGLDRDTVNSYLEILERLFLIRRLPAWHRNRGKRLTKAPKIHLLDTGLAASFAELTPEDWNTRRTDFGHLLESFFVQQLIAQSGWTDPSLQFHHYRDRDKVEVDCVITRGKDTWGIEIKTARSVSQSDLKGLKRLADQVGSDFRTGIVLYAGESTLSLCDGQFFAVPISKLWEL